VPFNTDDFHRSIIDRGSVVTCRVLIVTNRTDLHADIVAGKIVAHGGSTFRLNLDDFPRDYSLALDFTGDGWVGEIVHVPTDDRLQLSTIGSVWMRKPADYAFPSEDLALQEKQFACAEMDQFLIGLLHCLDCYWMSHPIAIRRANWKSEQLLRAARMGFRVPSSLIANRREAVDAFRAARGNDIVFKALSSPSLAAEKVAPEDRIAHGLPTTHITNGHGELLDAVREFPCFFQEYIPKRHEVRVTVIGNQVFAARIHSQDDPHTAVDFRDFSAEIKYEAERLPQDIEARCREFVQSYRLNYGAIDLIVTPDDEYVFLENNPAGQFLFVEQLVPELAMCDALARELVQGTRG
jgi:glutathione synthase/RimK-type ligase-like ATP-grasp enzyme